ncbi:MAG: class I SAM-dependent methyltransferase [Candidatus Aenigmatarchaeota archaeon]
MNDENPNEFEEIYSDYDLHLKDKTTVVKANMSKNYLKPKSRVLILGCGPCFEGKVFRNAGHYVVGVDVSDRFVDDHKDNFDEFIKADVSQKFSFDPESFDAVIAFELIEHLGFVNNFIAECNRVLKKNGVLILSTPSQSYWKTRLNLLFGNDILSDIHPRTFTPRSLAGKLEKLFVVKKMFGIGAFGFALSVRFPLISLCGDFIAVCEKR